MLSISMIGNAHLDPAWMWEWWEGMEAFIATCRSALERMEETPGFVFTCSSAAHYAWVEHTEPELFEKIRARVEEGRWEIVGGWWTQADCNIPSGEGLIRQGELGQAWFAERFGKVARVGYSPDAFGHAAGLPGVLRHVGLDSYIFCRPDPGELELPGPLFRWRSSNDAEVLAYRVPFHYNMYQTTVRKKVADLQDAFGGESGLAAGGRRLEECRRSGEWALFYGVGNHGGGPTREQIATILEIARSGEVEIGFGRIGDFFDRVDREEREDLPVLEGELQMNSPGTYSLHSTIKRLNRRSESELCRAEVFDVLAATLDDRYGERNDRVPEELRRAWREVCFNHFHDLLCGVAVTDALENTVHRYGDALASADSVSGYALRAIARRLDTSGAPQTLIAFNPHSFPIEGAIDFELWHDIDKDRWGEPIEIRLVDGEGKDQIVQRIEPRGKIGDDRIAGRFIGSVPPLGWRCWSLYYGEKGHPEEIVDELVVSGNCLQNAHLRVEFSEPSDRGRDSASVGSAPISRLLHRSSGLEFLSVRGGARPVRIDDDTDAWGHGVERFDRESSEQPELLEVEVVERGVVSGTIRTVSESRAMRVTQLFTLHRTSGWVDVRCRVENREEGMVKLSFDTTITGASTIASAHYDTILREADGRERPGGAWKGLFGKIDGRSVTLGVIDTLTHGFSANGSDLRLSLFRSTRAALHEPHPENRREDRRPIDIGTIEFRYRLVPLVGENPRSVLERHALELTRRPVVLLESPHPSAADRLPTVQEGVRISSDSIVVTTLRREDDGAITLRLFESSGEGSHGRIEIPLFGTTFEIELRGHEIRDVRIGPARGSRGSE